MPSRPDSRPFCPVLVHVDSLDTEHLSALRLKALEHRAVPHQFHYSSLRQSQLWLEVFRAHSPVATGTSVSALYPELARRVAPELPHRPWHLVSLGCGEGSKDVALLQTLAQGGHEVRWTPHDISLSLVLRAMRAGAAYAASGVTPLVADLTRLTDLQRELDHFDTAVPRIFTFYGLVPNLMPQEWLHLLDQLLRSGDHLLLSANLAPVPEHESSEEAYLAAVRTILPQYDNPFTARWLQAVLEDWGWSPALHDYRMEIARDGDLLRLEASMAWRETHERVWEGQTFHLRAGERLRLFFSYRYTLPRLLASLATTGLRTVQSLLSPCREEAVVWLTRD